MSVARTHSSARHSHVSHRTRPRDEDVQSIAPPETVASFAAPTVIPGDSVSQAGSRPHHSKLEAARSHYSHRSSRHSRSNVDLDDRSSGLLTAENLEVHNAEERSRASTPKPPEQLYVEVLENRTATGSFYSHNETPRQSLHPNDSPGRSHYSTRSPSPRVEVLSRAMEGRLSVSKSHVSAHPSRISRSHVSRSSEHRSASERAETVVPSKPPTVISRRAPSHSPPRSSTSQRTSRSHARSQSHAPTSTPTHVSSQVSHRTSRKESPPSRFHEVKAPAVYDVHEVAVYEEVPHTPSKYRETYTIEVEAAEDQERGREYKIHYRHEYPVYGDA